MEPFLIIGIAFVMVFTLEYLFPRKKNNCDWKWIATAIFYNLIQVGILLIGPYTWEKIVGGSGLFKLPYQPFVNGLIAYIINSWVFYHWHVLRHMNNFFWLYFHQVHHISNTINSLEAFVKHPNELIANSIIMTVITGPILGLDQETNAWLTVISAITEFFYHANIHTPVWLGNWIIQRPESHDYHHLLDGQTSVFNYGDLPIWDWLGGTLRNPTDRSNVKTGFSGEAGKKMLSFDALVGRNLIKNRPKPLPENWIRNMFISCLIILGSLNLIGYIYKSPSIMGIAFMTSSSPLPLVFTAYNGHETFSTQFEIQIEYLNKTKEVIIPTNYHYNKMMIPYNMKNMLGAAFSHGPFFKDLALIKIRDQILHWGLCQGNVANQFGITEPIGRADIIVRSKKLEFADKKWIMAIEC